MRAWNPFPRKSANTLADLFVRFASPFPTHASFTGPFKVNGVPVRRVNQAYVIATSTTVDVSGVNTSKFDDSYFARVESADSKGEDGFFATEDSKAVCSDERKKDQKAVDGAIKLSADLKAYLGARFSLKAGDKPHEMNF